MFFDVLEVAQLFHRLVDKHVVGTVVSNIHACKINITHEKINTIVANIPLGYLLTSEEIEDLGDAIMDRCKSANALIEELKNRESLRGPVKDILS